MTKNHLIRIAISEPQPGWWKQVRRTARSHGVYLHRFVTLAIIHYLAAHPSAYPPTVDNRCPACGAPLPNPRFRPKEAPQ